MAKVIKEIIIFLLVCLAMMLLFAVVLYEYIPSRKVVAEVVTYSATEEIQQQLADNVDQETNEVVLTYEVTSSDLNNYEITNEYVPGKSNPFAAISTSADSDITGNTTNSSGTTSNTTSNSTTSNTTTNSVENETGLK